ncbi:MAG: trypsin-like peptidase domain-containing protein [Planctomycetia bacterium]|nr:trypsin-like peptidase domain-containing protein [Planctomycetia bacterium]
MKKNTILCLASAFTASILTCLFLSNDNGVRPAHAQVTLPNQEKGSPQGQDATPNSDADFAARLAELSPQEQTVVKIYEERNKSVVNVETVFYRTHNFMFQESAEGRGSGIVLNKQGTILTNFHVVENADSVSITLYDGQSYPAKKIGLDPNTDIALLQIEAPAESLHPIVFGDSSRLLVGQTVYAIGNPFGYDRTMTQGIIANLNRTIESPQQFRQIKGVIQMDAAINPGNSGGPLLDSRGRMIGMNTAIASAVGENSGVGFAVPVNTIHRIATQLLENGKVVRGDIGIAQVTETEGGLLPVMIDDGGAADKAGLRGRKLVVRVINQGGARIRQVHAVTPREGMDFIVGVNGNPTRTAEEFITAVEEHPSGETITLNIIRQKQPMELQAVLQ